MQDGDEKDIRRATGAVGNRGFSGENRHPALRIQEDHNRDGDNFHRDGDTNMRHGPPDTEENFQRFRDYGGRRDRDNMRRGADDRWRTPDAFGRKDDRPPSPREDRLRDGDDLERNYRPAPPREDRLRDGDDFRRDYRPAPLRKDRLIDGDDFRRNYRPAPPREDRLRDGDDFRRDYRPAPLRKDRLRDGDDFRRDYRPALLRKDTLRDKDDFRQDYRPTPPREDRFRDGDDSRRDFRRTPPRKDRLRDRDDIQKRDDVDSGFRRGIGVNDLRRLGVGPTAGRDRDDEFRRRDDGRQRMVRGSDLSMGGEDGTPSIDNRDRDNFRPSQSNFRMQGNEKHDDTRYLTIYSFLFLKYCVKFDGDSQEVSQNNRKPSNTSVY